MVFEDKFRMRAILGAICVSTILLLSSCSATTTGTVKDDVTLSGETGRLEGLGNNYNGPQYNIAIVNFTNKTPSRALNIGQAAAEMLRTIVKQAGLEPVSLTESEMKEQERLIELQQSGVLKTGKKSAAEGFDTVDFRITGAITAYSEGEEGSDMLIAQSKSQIAKVQVDYALVDIATGKTLVAESGMGEYKKSTGGFLGMGSKSTADASLRDGALRDALTKAMSRMIAKLNDMPFQGRILAIDGPTIIIRAGTKSNLKAGTILGVYRPGQDLVDPDTGRVVGKREKKIGEVIIVSHENDRITDASIKSGVGFIVGDVIKVVRQEGGK